MASVLRILDQYGVPQTAIVKPYGNGLINHTWKVTNDKNENFILQRINTTVFKQPEDIASNLANLRDYLQKHFPRYPYISPLRTIDGMEFYYDEHDFYRLFPFVAGSHSIDTVQTAEQAFEAAKQFGLFSKLLSGFDHRQLKTTIPDFHNLSLRYYQFQQAIRDGDSYRIGEAKALIDYLQQQESIVQKFESIQNHEGFKIRVMHHDTKINNVLFDQHNKGICVIDLDTVMQGYFISDVGDMLRTYLSAANEEEPDVTKINVREDIFKAIAEGYLSEMNLELTAYEKAHFIYAGKFLTYMQSLRFLTDYLNHDVYYGSKYEGHNLVRATNQATLLERISEKEEKLSCVLNRYQNIET